MQELSGSLETSRAVLWKRATTTASGGFTQPGFLETSDDDGKRWFHTARFHFEEGLPREILASDWSHKSQTLLEVERVAFNFEECSRLLATVRGAETLLKMDHKS